MLIGLISWCLGAILSAPVGYLMNKGMEVAFDAEGLYTFVFSLGSPHSPVSCLPGMPHGSLFAMCLPTRGEVGDGD